MDQANFSELGEAHLADDLDANPTTLNRVSVSGAPPLVTLAVKAYNQEETVAAAVEAALAQTYSPLEVLLSDDCSDDATFSIMREIADRYSGPHRVVVNRNPTNLGIVGHMNRAAELASGRLIVEGAGDDISEPQRVERLAAAWMDGRVKAVHSAFHEMDGDGRLIARAVPDRRIIDAPGPDPLTLVTTKANCLGATAAWDRELFDRFGPIPEDCGVEDGVLFFRAALLDGIAFVDEPLIRYRIGGLSWRTSQSPGHNYLYGDRIKSLKWALSNARAFLKDLLAADVPDKAACEQICHEIIDRYEFEAWLAEQSPVSRMAAIPHAAMRSVADRDGFFLRQSLKHALGELYVAYYNRRVATAGDQEIALESARR